MVLACFQIHDQLIEQLGHAVQPRDVGLCVLFVIDLVDVNQERRRLGVDAEHLVHWIAVEAELISFGITRGIEFIKLATESGLGVELLLRKLALQVREILLLLFQIAFGRFIRNVVPLIVMGFDTE